VPYTDDEIAGAGDAAMTQGLAIADELRASGVEIAPDAELVAVIAYLQSLGKKAAPPDDSREEAPPPAPEGGGPVAGGP
jgi:cytochrome c oxidase cbb3-type subunit I/II